MFPIDPPCKAGDRVKITSHDDDHPWPIPVGTEGIVTDVAEFRRNRLVRAWHIAVTWDNGRKSTMFTPPDKFDIITKGPNQ